MPDGLHHAVVVVGQNAFTGLLILKEINLISLQLLSGLNMTLTGQPLSHL